MVEESIHDGMVMATNVFLTEHLFDDNNTSDCPGINEKYMIETICNGNLLFIY